jgi:hypothetical protein
MLPRNDRNADASKCCRILISRAGFKRLLNEGLIETKTGVKDRLVPTFNIAFCPFCGKNLFEFFKEDNYAIGVKATLCKSS